MYTLEDTRKDVAKLVGTSGMCPDDQRVLTAINEARRILFDLGDWEQFVDPLCIYPQDGNTITLPSRYKYAKSAYICKQRIVVENDWFNQIGNWDIYCGPCLGNLVKVPGNFVTFRDWPTCFPNQKVCCPPTGFWPLLVSENSGDIGTELTFKGHGVMRELLSVTRTITAAPWHEIKQGNSEQKFLQLTHLIKPKTLGRIRLYGWDGANKILLSYLDPDDLNPQFTRYRVPGRIRGPVLVKAKKKYIPLSDDPTEIVEVSADVLIHVLQAITEREGRNMTGYSTNIQAAVGLLNKQNAGPESTSTVPIRFSRAYKVRGLVEY